MQDPKREHQLLTEIACLYAALIRVVRNIEDPVLKAEIADLVWPPHPKEQPAMTEPVLAVVPAVTVTEWIRDVLERSVVTFIIGFLTVSGLAQFTDFSTDWGKKLASAALFALASAVVRVAFPKSGFGLPPMLDVAARAALSGAQAAAVIILANTQLDWFVVSNWQLLGGAALAAALSVIKGAIALRVKPGETVTPASLAPAR